MSEFLEKNIIEEIEWYESSQIISVNQHDMGENNRVMKSLLETDILGKYTLKFYQEAITDIHFYEFIVYSIDRLRKKGHEVFLSTASIIPSPITFNSLTNLYINWRNFYQRIDVSWDLRKSELSWPIEIYSKDKIIQSNRVNRTLISVRKEKSDRSLLFDRISNLDLDINRYVKYRTDANEETIDDIKRANLFPVWKDVLREYEQSYFSFVVETDHTHDGYFACQMTEKTILPLFAGSIPIIFAQPNFIKHFTDMGFWVANDDFGFGLGDVYPGYSKYKLDSYVKCVENVSKLSIDECKKYWLDNREKIENNYKLIYSILNYGK